MAKCGVCGGDLLRRHCDDGHCGWVVCADKECGATTDATQDEPIYFERKNKQAK